jgi:hypothetical protein
MLMDRNRNVDLLSTMENRERPDLQSRTESGQLGAATGQIQLAVVSARPANGRRRGANGRVRRPSPAHAASASGSITSAVHIERMAHLVLPGALSHVRET